MKSNDVSHYRGALVHHYGKLYLLGGYETDDVTEYDMMSCEWKKSDYKMPVSGLYRHSAFFIDS